MKRIEIYNQVEKIKKQLVEINVAFDNINESNKISEKLTNILFDNKEKLSKEHEELLNKLGIDYDEIKTRNSEINCLKTELNNPSFSDNIRKMIQEEITAMEIKYRDFCDIEL